MANGRRKRGSKPKKGERESKRRQSHRVGWIATIKPWLQRFSWPSVTVLLALATALFWGTAKDEYGGDAKESSCAVVMAPSSLPGDSGWGLFSLTGLPKSVPALPGDIVIHTPDIPVTHAKGMQTLINHYMWVGKNAGGQFEGGRVLSNLPGIGQLANGHLTQFNMVRAKPSMDSAGLHRVTSPGAGAISYDHNNVFYTHQEIPAGGELLVDFGTKWAGWVGNEVNSGHVTARRNVSWLKKNGMCVDNIRSGLSTNHNAGRGAFATRSLQEGTVIAPLPVIPVSRASLKMVRIVESASTRRHLVDAGQQLLLNYCFGHSNSSVLLYPYSPGVNFINHDSEKANAQVQWSTSSLHFGREWLDWPVDKVLELRHSGLLLELIATREIEPGEEIFIDYGEHWEEAWDDHVRKWNTSPKDLEYVYPSELDDLGDYVRTVSEQQDNPYPANVMTACYYHYESRQKDPNGFMYRWIAVNGIFNPPNLRPCTVMARQEESDGNFLYTVSIENLKSEEKGEKRIPENEEHLVARVPRNAIQFVDRVYSSDQHLTGAFRHEVGLSDLYPQQWMDLS